MLFTFLWTWNTQDTTCWNPKTQTNPESPQRSTSLFRLWPFLLKDRFASQQDILCTLFTAGSFCSAAVKELFPTLEFVPHPEVGAHLSVLSSSPGTAGHFRQSFPAGCYIRKVYQHVLDTVFYCQSSFTLLSQITTGQLHTFPEIHDYYHSDLAYFMIAQLTPTFGLLNQFQDWNHQSIVICLPFRDELFLPCWRNPATWLLLQQTFGRARYLFTTRFHPSDRHDKKPPKQQNQEKSHPCLLPYCRGLLQTLLSYYLGFPFYNWVCVHDRMSACKELSGDSFFRATHHSIQVCV